MIAEVKSKSRRFDILYCYDTSRFSRRQYHAQMYKHLLKSHGVELVFLKLPKTDTILDPIIESLREFADGSYVGPGEGRYRDRSEWEIHRDTHEAMISDEEAEAIFRERDKQKRKKSRFRHNHYLLSSQMRCTCGARIDGDGGYYRCHHRCGVRGIKKQTLERAVLDCFHNELFSEECLVDLQDEICRLLDAKAPQQNHLIAQLKKEIRAIQSQISDLASMLTEVKHRRPLIQRIDALEDERQELDLRLQDMNQVEYPELLTMKPEDLEEIAEKWRSDLESGTMDKRKAVF